LASYVKVTRAHVVVAYRS